MSQTENENDYLIKEIVELFGERLPLCSPSDFNRLEERMKKEEDLADVFLRHRNLADACEEGTLFLLAQIEYRIKRHSSIYYHIYGTRGMGKSEVAMSVSILIIQAYRKYADIDPIMSFGRSPSELNKKLSRATKRKKTLMLISDEAEEEQGTGSATEEVGLLGNLDTMRVLQHSVGRISIPYRRGFGLRCDFILEPVLQDIDEKINYCVVYTVDPDSGRKKAKYLVDMPLHKDAELREAYEDWKLREQEKFTGSGGRRSHLKERLAPFVDGLYQAAKEEEEFGEEITSWSQLEDILAFDVENGDSLVAGEASKVMKRAFRLLKSDKRAERRRKKTERRVYSGQLADMQKAILDRLIERGVPALEVEMLAAWSTGLESQTDIARRMSNQYNMKITQKDVSVKTGRIRDAELGYAFEDVYAAYLERKPEFTNLTIKQGGYNTPEPDIIVMDKDMNVQMVFSCKCHWDNKTISLPRSQIAGSELEYIGLGVPVYLVMFDFLEKRLFDPIQVTTQLAFTFRKDGSVKERWPA